MGSLDGGGFDDVMGCAVACVVVVAVVAGLFLGGSALLGFMWRAFKWAAGF